MSQKHRIDIPKALCFTAVLICFAATYLRSSTSSAATCSDDSTDVVEVNVFINLPVELMGLKSNAIMCR
eukprot:scaffold17443_cov38-Cyclotella_meneghiniana.AAC.3